TIGDYGICSGKLGKHAQLDVEFSRQPNIVRIKKRDKLTSRQLRAGVSRGARTATLLEPQHANLRSESSVQERNRFVSRSIVDHNDFYFSDALLQRAGHRLANDRRAVPGGNDDG